MTHAQSAKSMDTTEKRRYPADEIYRIGETMRVLDPGELSKLRRLSLNADDWGAPFFWRLVSEHDLKPLGKWAAIIQMMATLTEKGRDDAKPSPHDWSHRFGASLCDGGMRDWGVGVLREQLKPVFSESRFARLLSARGATKRILLARAVAMLAQSKDANRGVDCADVARLVLFEDGAAYRKIARDYYARLDRASRHIDSTDSSIGENA